jgi:hypothetical protein
MEELLKAEAADCGIPDLDINVEAVRILEAAIRFARDIWRVYREAADEYRKALLQIMFKTGSRSGRTHCLSHSQSAPRLHL